MPEKMLQDRLFRRSRRTESEPSASTDVQAPRRVEQLVRLSYDERERLMRQHGALGREFKGRIIQVITGSTDWTTGSGRHALRVHVDD